MSVFATLRRKRDRSKGSTHGTVLVAESKSEPIFNSTPNLHKIHPVRGKPPSTSFLHKKGHSPVFYPEEDPENVIVEDDATESRYGNFSNRRSSSAAESEMSHTDRKFSFQGGRGNKGASPSGSLRHFASMISMFGSLKRSKSSKRMVYESTHDLEKPEKRETTEFMRHRAAGRSRSPDPSMFTSKSSGRHPSDSNTMGGNQREKGALSNNTEPGVRSSGSSSDDDEIRRNYSIDHFKQSESIDPTRDDHGHNFDYTTTKTEEELKRTKIIIQGIKKFNMDPKKGIEFLVENDILQNTPDDVAKFLKEGEGLSKMAIGKYLGEHIDFNEEVMQAFLDLHNFKDLILVQALRDFLWSFRLPGESQKIDRMMEAFAKRYCQSNPGIFSCTDTCYLLSYSIIMLNTTLHNPSVKDKPTVERFIQMNRDVDSGKSLNRGFLVHMYNSILAEPFKIPPEDANDLILTFFNPNIEGWLWKQGGYKTWKRRWFILSNNCLYYFKFTTDKSPRGIIPLENVHAKEVTSSKPSDLFTFILYKKSTSSLPSDVIKTCKTLSNGTTVLSQNHTITVASINLEDRQKWVQSINQNNSSSDFYDVLTMKKRDLEAQQQTGSLKGKRGDPVTSTFNRKDTPKKVVVRKSLISQPSTAPNFEFKDKLPPELITPQGPRKDPNNYFKASQPVSSSFSSISSGSGLERDDSSYGSFSDISRSRSESRILDCTHDGSLSSVEHDTGSLDSRRTSGISVTVDSDLSSSKDGKFDLSKKLSVIEESQNQSDRSSGSSGANFIMIDDESNTNANPRCLGYRKLSEEDDCSISFDKNHFASKSDASVGANARDSGNCDKYKGSTTSRIISANQETSELSKPIERGNEGVSGNGRRASTTKFSRSGSIESDV